MSRTCWTSWPPARAGIPWRSPCGYTGYGALKRDVADAVVELLRPVRERHAELAADPAEVDKVLREGAGRARELARPVVDRVYEAIGLLAP